MSAPFRRFGRLVAGFGSSRSALAAVEFAMIMPVLIVLMLGGTEIARFLTISRSVTNLANSLATLVSERTTTFNYNDAVFDFYSALTTSPFLLKDAARRGTVWTYDVAITLSSVIFTPTVSSCTQSCTYTAKVAWSVNSPIAGQRSCSTAPTSATDTAAPSLTALPQDAYTSGSVIVADVIYTYTPIFGSQFLGTMVIRKSFYIQPRYLFPVTYTAAGFDNGYVCH